MSNKPLFYSLVISNPKSCVRIQKKKEVTDWLFQQHSITASINFLGCSACSQWPALGMSTIRESG